MGEQHYLQIDKCRTCGSTNLVEFYKTEEIPVAGIYYDKNSKEVDIKAPVTLCYCKNCGLVQLKETIHPDIYKNYSFIGNSSLSYEKHLEMVANMLIHDWNVTCKKVYEVGASNGILLAYLKKMGNNQVAGIEPSQKLCDYAQHNGINIQQGYYNKEFISKHDIGKFDCIIIRHVLEHIDELNDMVFALKESLEDDGLLVIEVPNIIKIVDNHLFSNVFHEHLNYFSLSSLNHLLFSYGFNMVHKEEITIHGGSILAFYKISNQLVANERVTLVDIMKNHLENFATKAQYYYSKIYEKITKLNEENKVVHGYGASHRTFVLLGNSRLSAKNIPIIYDNNAFLHYKRLNGFHSLVLPTNYITTNHPDAILIFATSYEQEIMDFLVQECNYHGEIISLTSEVVCRDY